MVCIFQPQGFDFDRALAAARKKKEPAAATRNLVGGYIEVISRRTLCWRSKRVPSRPRVSERASASTEVEVCEKRACNDESSTKARGAPVTC